MSQFLYETWAKNPIRSRNTLVECWAIANLSGRDQAEQASQTQVFMSFCAHNRKGTLPVRLYTA